MNQDVPRKLDFFYTSVFPAVGLSKDLDGISVFIFLKSLSFSAEFTKKQQHHKAAAKRVIIRLISTITAEMELLLNRNVE